MGYLQENNPWCKELFFYHVPFDGSSFTGDDEEESVKATLCTHRLCTAGMQTLMDQKLVADAVSDAEERKDHTERRYTFVVDYGQNMELPVYNDEQPSCTYYYSPLSAYNLGVVNHAHTYENGDVGKHMYAHIYHEGVGKKGANNVSSLIVKTLRQLNLL